MKIPDRTVQELLAARAAMPPEKVAELVRAAAQQRKPLLEVVFSQTEVTDEEMARWYSELINVPFIKLEPKNINPALLKLIPEYIARRYRAVLFGEENGTRQLAMEDPEDLQAVDFIQKQLGARPAIYLALKHDIAAALDLYRGEMSSEITKVITEDMGKEAEDEEVKEEDLAENSPIAQTVTLLIEYAVKSSASDIHIEPREDYVQIRYRVDGVLREADKLPKKVQAALISRIKILANLKIDERRLPQDGRFKIAQSGKMYALRVSTLPIADGEKVVIRLLDESNDALTVQGLGFWGGALHTITKAIAEPHGMILVTGPTGSGKSTTLFSVLSMLNSSSVNISTVEDPIEYRIKGVNQTQVNPKAGMTFASGLRALLRQDPNIIMVGEIRDRETADMGVQAALTGHLVFSTLHTNNAATCLPRLLDMGVEPFLIASTVRAVVGQRLVRRICQECRVAYAPEHNEVEELKKLFGLSSPESLQFIHDQERVALEEKIGGQDTELSTDGHGILRLWKPKEDGCESCNGIGYKGRIGIYEVLENTTDIQNLIMSDTTSEAIQNQAIRNGMLTMHIDGFIKALRGQTAIEEILRVTRE